ADTVDETLWVRPDVFSFHIFIRNLLRRFSALSFFHAEKELNIDFKGLIEEAQKINTAGKKLRLVEITRYSARTKQKMPLRGLVGEVSFEGDITPFTSLLRAGEFVHVGKNTSFGFGYYRIISS
ncbi:CRISPR system precrRNA processing endoribonuclease RAMP protein Cas6, partial [Thermodesulfatator autotrophicus]|uniref:CRISPR system precrRNA processing endoribonuclease RAMP protein Cas6 n=1 Tax=Thermodesulfatator autotrophicus TaxID=1795632 RepID=UPI0012F8547A